MLRIRIRLALLFIACTAVWMLIGAALMALIHEPGIGAALGLIAGILYWTIASLASERFVLDAYGAKLLGVDWAPNLTEVVRELSAKAGIPQPALYNVPLAAPNAFAVGRKDAGPAIVLTNGLTKHLSQDEVRAVMALMIARLKQPEAAAWPLAATIAGMPLWGVCLPGLRDFLKRWLPTDATGLTVVDRILLVMATPLSAFALWVVCDGRCVADADLFACRLLGDSAPLESALHKMEDKRPRTWWGRSPYNPATAMLFAVPPIRPLDGMDGDAELSFFRHTQWPFVAPLPSTGQRHLPRHTATPTSPLPAPTASPAQPSDPLQSSVGRPV